MWGIPSEKLRNTWFWWESAKLIQLCTVLTKTARFSSKWIHTVVSKIRGCNSKQNSQFCTVLGTRVPQHRLGLCFCSISCSGLILSPSRYSYWQWFFSWIWCSHPKNKKTHQCQTPMSDRLFLRLIYIHFYANIASCQLDNAHSAFTDRVSRFCSTRYLQLDEGLCFCLISSVFCYSNLFTL